MKLPIYQIDAFTGEVFKGNPAAVVPLKTWLPDETLQSIANENNVSETAFFAPEGDYWRLRWFTPAVEVDLCGHATLASAYVLFSRFRPGANSVGFQTRSGVLTVARDGDLLALDLPAMPAEPVEDASIIERVAAALGMRPAEVWRARDLMAVLGAAADVRDLEPDMAAIARLDAFALIATATGDEPGVDFVSRFFAPAKGVPEDPVTGSSHCTLAGFWAKRIGRERLVARQVSRRGGELVCTDRGDRVTVAGRAVLYLEGSIEV